jgi:hypothetical protein
VTWVAAAPAGSACRGALLAILECMELLRLAPSIDIGKGRLEACTSGFAQLLWLYSYCRCISIDRERRQIAIRTRRLWCWRRLRVVGFDQVSRILYRAQGLPALSPWRLLSPDANADSAVFFVSLALKHERHELPLFVVWQQQPRPADWLDRLAGGAPPAAAIGDEAAGQVVALLHEYLGVPIGGH